MYYIHTTFCILNLIYSFSPANYPKDHALYNPKNAKKLYYFKSECPDSKPIMYCALKPKSYMILTEDSLRDIQKKSEKMEEVRTRPGLDPSVFKDLDGFHIKNKGVIKALTKQLGIIQYMAALIANCRISADYKKLQSVAGLPHLTSLTKLALSSLDDKTQTLSCGFCTRPHGHYNTDMKCYGHY